MKIPKLFNKKKEPKPKTSMRSGSDQLAIFQNSKGRSRAKVEEYQTIYSCGGVLAQGLDCYPQLMLSQSTDGFTFTGNNEPQVEYIKSIIDGQDFYNQLYQLILDSVVAGDGLAEVVKSRDGNFHHLVPRNPAYFTPHYDLRGDIDYYMYKIDAMKQDGITMHPKNMLHIVTKAGVNHDHFGLSLIGCAYDDIWRDATICESIKNGIERHGTPKYNITVGTEDAEAEDSDIQAAASVFKNINSKNEFVHSNDVTVEELDTAGVSGVAENSTFSLERALTGMGIPLEMIGISSGSPNKATSDAVIAAFAKRLVPLQKMINSQLFTQSWEPILAKQFGPENVERVYIDFGDITAASLIERAEIVSKLTSNAMNPFMIIGEDEARDILGYQPRDDYDVVDEPEEPDTEE